MVRTLPEYEPLDVEGDAPVGLFLNQRRIVARGDVRAAVALPQPISVDLDFHVPARRPDRDDLSCVRADGLVARIAGASVLLRVPSRTVRGLDAVSVQRNPVNLNERGDGLATHVRDRTRRRERSFERNPSGGRIDLVSAPVEGLMRIRGSEDVTDRDQVRGTRDVRIPRCQPARCRRRRAPVGRRDDGQIHRHRKDQQEERGRKRQQRRLPCARSALTWSPPFRHGGSTTPAGYLADVYTGVKRNTIQCNA